MALLSNKILKNPANYLYMFASTQFLAKIDAKHRGIIAAKAFYQKKTVVNEVGNFNYDAARAELREAIIATYGYTPAECLTRLARGEEVAGKNWAQGIYGVGAVKRNNFQQDITISVDPATGAITKSGKQVSTDSDFISGKSKKTGNIIGYYYKDKKTGRTYTSHYDKTTKTWYAGTMTDKDANVFNADGTEVGESAVASIWESVIGGVEQFVTWLLDTIKPSEGETVLTADKVLPEQTDGFVTVEGEGDSMSWLPWVVGGAAILAVVGSRFAPAMYNKYAPDWAKTKKK